MAADNELENKVKSLEAEVARLKKQLARGEVAGWLVITPNPNYNEISAGVQFRAGRAFLPKSEKNDKLARDFRIDFGYEVRETSGFTEIGGADGDLARSLIDVLTVA